jgi:hypothetical protein
MLATRKSGILITIFFLLTVSACASEPEPTVVPTATLTATLAPTTAPTHTATLEPTKTLTVRPVGSLTATPRPSTTPSLTATPRPTLTPTHTATPRPSATSSPTVTPSPTATPTLVPPDWQIQTLLVGPGQPARLYVLQFARDPSPDTSRVRLLVSDDTGTTWKPFEGGLPAAPSCVHNINLDYATADPLYASTCQGLYRWTSGAWNLISPQETGMIAIVYQQSNTIWATGYKASDAPILHSYDGGKTWSDSSSGMVHFSGIANIGIDPRDPNTVYAIINPKYAGSYLRRGTANGLWQTIPTPLKNAQIDIGMTIDGTTSTLYVTAYDSTKSRWQLWRSTNANDPDIGKISWDMLYDFGAGVSATVLASGTSSQGLAIYVRLLSNCSPSGSSCQVSTQRTMDSGKTWTIINIPSF